MGLKVSKKLKTVLIISALIILFASIEALINAKSIEAYNNYKDFFPDHTSQDFLGFLIINYLSNILEPVIISLYLFFTYGKLKPNKLYAIVFGGMIIIKLVNKILTFNIYSVFYYILLILYVLLMISVNKYSNSTEERI